jgi:metal-responsive CopG/Arc/MetJ family transcriptional regulator
MMKTYNVNLDEESVEALDRWLQAAGISRSAYVDTLIRKTVESMGLKKIPDYSKMTLPQLFKMIGGVGEMMEGKKK